MWEQLAFNFYVHSGMTIRATIESGGTDEDLNDIVSVGERMLCESPEERAAPEHQSLLWSD